MPEQAVALVTGAARRLGATITRKLHDNGYAVVVHCRHSITDANALVEQLNARRKARAVVVTGDLVDESAPRRLVEETLAAFGRLDVLVNNASSFFPTPVASTTRSQWNDLVGSNFTAPFFLVQAALPSLKAANGAIINMLDIHASRPLSGHAVYSSAKAGLHMLTRALANELAPEIRVNGIAPGAILWPEKENDEDAKQRIIMATPLRRTGTPEDIAETALFLARSPFITGQVIAVDGGRSNC